MTLHEIEQRIEMLEQISQARRDAAREGRDVYIQIPNSTGEPLSVQLLNLEKMRLQKLRQMRDGNG